jgi:hypothetical protein
MLYKEIIERNVKIKLKKFGEEMNEYYFRGFLRVERNTKFF